MSDKRRDKKNRILRTGESQEADGRYKLIKLDSGIGNRNFDDKNRQVSNSYCNHYEGCNAWGTTPPDGKTYSVAISGNSALKNY